MAAAAVVHGLWWLNPVLSIQLKDQCFARVVTEDDLHPHMVLDNLLIQPLKKEFIEDSGISEIIDDTLEFRITLDVRQFQQPELTVQLVNDVLEIRGSSNLREDGAGSVRRNFLRKYHAPYGVRQQNLLCNLTEEGLLVVQAYKESDDDFEVEVMEANGN